MSYQPISVTFPALPDCQVTGVEVYDDTPSTHFCDVCDLPISDRLVALYSQDVGPLYYFCEACVELAARYAK